MNIHLSLMKIRLLLLLSFLLCALCCAKEQDNQPAGRQLMLADPYILPDDGTYYMYGTSSPNGIVVYESKDLKTWEGPCGNATEGLALHKEDSWGEKNFWAPEVYRMGNISLPTAAMTTAARTMLSAMPCRTLR